MDHEWGRSASAGTWLSTRPAWALSTLLLAVVSSIGIGQYQYTRWTPLQRFYLAPYVRSTILSQLGFTTSGRYALLTVVDRRRQRLALDVDVQPASTAAPGHADSLVFAVTREAGRAGVDMLAITTERYDYRAVQAFLRTWIYGDQRVGDLAWRPAVGGLTVLLLGLLIAAPHDAARARARRHGRRLKGPELVSPSAFTQRLQADGIGWRQTRRRGVFGMGRPVWVRVPRALESSHFLVMGDTGTGKSAIIRQLLLQVQERGETAIVYDPAQEYEIGRAHV